MDYILHILILILLYTILAQSLNLVSGFSNMISLAHIGFYGMGAYTTAILSTNYDFPVLITLPIAMILSSILAGAVSIIALRTVDDYFIIITLGIQIVIFAFMNNWVDLTNGPIGIPGIPPVALFGIELNDKISYVLFVGIISVICYMFLKRITSSPFGRVLLALSEDEIFAQSLGKDVYKFKIISFTIGAVLASIPGVLYAHYVSYIDPSSFNIHESIFILSIVIIGGLRSLTGSTIAAAFLIIMPEILRFIGMPNSIAANVRQIIYGSLLIFVIYLQSFEYDLKHIFRKAGTISVFDKKGV